MTDNDFLLRVLADGKWHELNEILRYSQDRRGHGMTVHSRAADLRKRGYRVDTMQRRNKQGRTDSFYKLGTLEEAVAGRGLVDPPATDGVTVSSSVPDFLAGPSLSDPEDGSGTLPLSLFDTVSA